MRKNKQKKVNIVVTKKKVRRPVLSQIVNKINKITGKHTSWQNRF
jgi:hypothetical protein